MEGKTACILARCNARVALAACPQHAHIYVILFRIHGSPHPRRRGVAQHSRARGVAPTQIVQLACTRVTQHLTKEMGQRAPQGDESGRA